MFLMFCSAVPWLMTAAADAALPSFPRVCVVPQPDRQIAFEVDGAEVARYHYGLNPEASKPYVYPLIGPAGRSLTRLTHPHDPYGHRHHLGIWIAHQNVNGANFWEEGNGTTIVHDRIEKLTDGLDAASIVTRNRWLDAAGTPLVDEVRTMTLRPLDGGELYLDIALALTPAAGTVTFDKTPFGFLAVRVAETMSTNDGGGTIRNSEGGVNEPEVLWKRARWVDYTGRVTPDVCNGITFFDHPSNPRYPTYYHVRGDGWMGASFCYAEPYTLEAGQTLALHYRLYAHGPDASPETLERHAQQFAEVEDF